MKIKAHHILIIAAIILVGILGSKYTDMGMLWYNTELIKPALVPSKWVFPLAWNIIFIATAISLIMVWDKGHEAKKFLFFKFKTSPDQKFWLIIILFVLNGVLNVYWNYIFFVLHDFSLAFKEMILLEIIILAKIFLIQKISKPAALLLIPYAIWVGFASYITYQIMLIN